MARIPRPPKPTIPNFNDSIIGTNSSEVFSTNVGNDSVDARGGNDIADLGVGRDTMDGGAGTDTLILTWTPDDYDIRLVDGFWQIRDREGVDGTDTVRNVERLYFREAQSYLFLGDYQNFIPTPAAAINTVTEDATPDTIGGDLLLVETDHEGDALRIASTSVGTHELQYGTLTVNADGTYSYVLDNTNEAVNALNDGQSLSEVFSFRLTDHGIGGTLIGTSSPSTLTITIQGKTDVLPVTSLLTPTQFGTVRDFSVRDQSFLIGPNGERTAGYDVYFGDNNQGVRDGQPNEVSLSNLFAVLSDTISRTSENTVVVDSPNPDRIGQTVRQREFLTYGQREDRAQIEYDVSAVAGPVQSATFSFVVDGRDSSDITSTFQIWLYAADGTITLSDYLVTGTVVGSLADATSSGTERELDIDPAVINQMLDAGVDYIGVQVRIFDYNTNGTRITTAGESAPFTESGERLKNVWPPGEVTYQESYVLFSDPRLELVWMS